MEGHSQPGGAGDSLGGGGTTGSNSTRGISNGADKSSSSDDICGLKQSYAIGGCIILGIVIVAVAVIVGIAVAGGNGEGGSSGSGGINSGNFGGDFARFQQLQNVFRNISDTGKMTDPSSAEFLALKWLTTDDPQQLSPNNTTQRSMIIERFCLAVLYYSTGGVDAADSETVGGDGTTDDSGSSTTTWVDDSGWLTGESVCEWKGISCTDAAATEGVFGIGLGTFHSCFPLSGVSILVMASC